jgi:flagellar motility protein MotE (MotC chaperone)
MTAARGKAKNVRNQRGVLLIIAILLMGSALVRATIGAGQAMANAVDPDAPAPDPNLTCESSDDLKDVLAALQSKERRLELQQEQIAARMQALTQADIELESKLARLVQAEESLRATVAFTETAADDDITRLVSVYEAMKPKEAALLFEEMEPEFAAGFLGRMRPEAAAGVMAGLSPQSAYSMSVILAGRNARAPRD